MPCSLPRLSLFAVLAVVFLAAPARGSGFDRETLAILPDFDNLPRRIHLRRSASFAAAFIL